MPTLTKPSNIPIILLSGAQLKFLLFFGHAYQRIRGITHYALYKFTYLLTYLLACLFACL